MIIKPWLTEKSLAQSKKGRYTFSVPLSFSKGQSQRAIEDSFKVKVADVWSLKMSGERTLSRKRREVMKPDQKFVLVTLERGRLDLFESSGGGGGQKKEKREMNSEKEAKKKL